MIYQYPETIQTPPNETSDGLCVFSIWRDRNNLIPRMKKNDSLHIKTLFGEFMLTKQELSRCEKFPQIKYRPDEPMIMLRIKSKPVGEQEQERLEVNNLIQATL